jgi:hypothetical protein
MLNRAILSIVTLICAAGTAHAQNDTLVAQVYTTLGLQNPSAPTRVVPVTSDSTATIQNPFNYQFGFGLTGQYADFSFGMVYEYARNNGLNFVNVVYTGRYQKDAYEIGTRYHEHDRGNGFYRFSLYAEGKAFDWIGVGITREYIEPWLKDPKTLARFSLSRNKFTFLKLRVTIRAEYEIGAGRDRQYVYMDIQNFKYKRFSLIPNYEFERNKFASGVENSYKGQLLLSVAID